MKVEFHLPFRSNGKAKKEFLGESHCKDNDSCVKCSCVAVTRQVYKCSSESELTNNCSSPQIYYSNSENELISPSYALKLLNNLYDLRNDRFSDVKIIVDGCIFRAHKVILTASSSYFRAMFTNKLMEFEKDEVELHSISPKIFSLLIDFIYSGAVTINTKNVEELIVAADMLELMDVVTACTTFFKEQIDCTNAMGIYRFADCHNFKEIRDLASDFINDNFPLICKGEEYVELPKEYIEKFISSEMIRIDSEVQVFHCTLRWLNHDIEERRPYIFEMLNKIRVPLISSQHLRQAVEECLDPSLRVALKFVMKKGDRTTAEPRLRAKKNIYVIGGSKREHQNTWAKCESTYDSVEKFDTFKRCWSPVSSMRIARIQPAVATLNGRIFVVGGEQDSAILANGECYDPGSDTWLTMESMIVPRCEFGLCAHEGSLYAFGGWVGSEIGDSMEKYDVAKNTWTMMKGKLEEPRFSMGIVSYNGLIYMVGGCTNKNRHNDSLFSFDPLTNEWRKLKPMNVARCQMGIAILDDHLYVVGGNDKDKPLAYVEKYSFQLNKWFDVSPLRVARANPAVAAADGKLYCIGGDENHVVNFYRSHITIDSVEIYDPYTNKWTEFASLPESRSEAGIAVV